MPESTATNAVTYTTPGGTIIELAPCNHPWQSVDYDNY